MCVYLNYRTQVQCSGCFLDFIDFYEIFTLLNYYKVG